MAVKSAGTGQGGGGDVRSGCHRMGAIGRVLVAMREFPPHIGLLDHPRQWTESTRMARILVVNPNSSIACSEGIAAALAPFHLPGGPEFEVTTLVEGPPA